MTNSESAQAIEKALDQVRPHIQMDGGNVHFVKFENNIVYVRLTGACVGCPASIYTLKLGIEQSIKAIMPEVTEVIALDEDDYEN